MAFTARGRSGDLATSPCCHPAPPREPAHSAWLPGGRWRRGLPQPHSHAALLGRTRAPGTVNWTHSGQTSHRLLSRRAKGKGVNPSLWKPIYFRELKTVRAWTPRKPSETWVERSKRVPASSGEGGRPLRRRSAKCPGGGHSVAPGGRLLAVGKGQAPVDLKSQHNPLPAGVRLWGPGAGSAVPVPADTEAALSVKPGEDGGTTTRAGVSLTGAAGHPAPAWAQSRKGRRHVPSGPAHPQSRALELPVPLAKTPPSGHPCAQCRVGPLLKHRLLREASTNLLEEASPRLPPDPSGFTSRHVA